MYAELIQTMRIRVCTICKKRKKESSFYLAYRRTKDGGRTTRRECKDCGNAKHQKYFIANKRRINKKRRIAYQKDKSKAIASNLKRYYGLTMSEYDELFKQQKGRCKICNRHQTEFERRFDVDHCHKKNHIRGLLCIRCNRGLGLFHDNVKVLAKAITYLKDK